MKTVVVKVPVLVLSLLAAAVFLFVLLSSFSTCNCPSQREAPAGVASSASCSSSISGGLAPSDSNGPGTAVSGAAGASGGRGFGSGDRISASPEDVRWLMDQIILNGLRMEPNVLRKGINPRSREKQLEDLNNYKGISHYEGEEYKNHIALMCPGELLVEEHHSYYGEPWAGGRDVFEFLAESVRLVPGSHVLEIGCGTLRVGLHFIRHLDPGHFHCLEQDRLSLLAAFRYELPSQGLLNKRPLIIRDNTTDLSRFGSGFSYDLVYASAVFLHMPDDHVWEWLEKLANRLTPFDGRIFVSHNIKFCSRLGGEECLRRLKNVGLDYLGKHTHDSLLFNHYEIWFEFRRPQA